MRDWPAPAVGVAAEARLVAGEATCGPRQVRVDSREVGPGDLFVGLPGARVDGSAYAAAALRAGAWGALVAAGRGAGLAGLGGVVLEADDPLRALHALARAWRRALGATVVGITGSVGKTSTRALLAEMLAPHRRVAASRGNFNTEIGLPLELLRAPAGTEVVVLELAMRGPGQIAELARICEPDVGVVTNVGPVHLEQLGSLEGVGRAKGELLRALGDDAAAVVPHGEPLLAHALRPGLRVTTFGADPRADVHWREPGRRAWVVDDERPVELATRSGPTLVNALAALAAARAVGVAVAGRVAVAPEAHRGERIALGEGILVVSDCYNASPPSMRAALDDLSREDPPGRRVAVLGDMLELGSAEAALHREVGERAAAAGVDVLVAVGRRAGWTADGFGGPAHRVADGAAAGRLAVELVEPGDVVLVKASHGMRLWTVTEALRAARGAPGDG